MAETAASVYTAIHSTGQKHEAQKRNIKDKLYYSQLKNLLEFKTWANSKINKYETSTNLKETKLIIRKNVVY